MTHAEQNMAKLAEMLAQYRNNERDMPSYKELAELAYGVHAAMPQKSVVQSVYKG